MVNLLLEIYDSTWARERLDTAPTKRSVMSVNFVGGASSK